MPLKKVSIESGADQPSVVEFLKRELLKQLWVRGVVDVTLDFDPTGLDFLVPIGPLVEVVVHFGRTDANRQSGLAAMHQQETRQKSRCGQTEGTRCLRSRSPAFRVHSRRILRTAGLKRHAA